MGFGWGFWSGGLGWRGPDVWIGHNGSRVLPQQLLGTNEAFCGDARGEERAWGGGEEGNRAVWHYTPTSDITFTYFAPNSYAKLCLAMLNPKNTYFLSCTLCVKIWAHGNNIWVISTSYVLNIHHSLCSIVVSVADKSNNNKSIEALNSPQPSHPLCSQRVRLSIQWSRLCLLTCSSSMTPLSTRGVGPQSWTRWGRGREKENKQGDTSAISQLLAPVTHLKEAVAQIQQLILVHKPA